MTPLNTHTRRRILHLGDSIEIRRPSACCRHIHTLGNPARTRITSTILLLIAWSPKLERSSYEIGLKMGQLGSHLINITGTTQDLPAKNFDRASLSIMILTSSVHAGDPLSHHHHYHHQKHHRLKPPHCHSPTSPFIITRERSSRSLEAPALRPTCRKHAHKSPHKTLEEHSHTDAEADHQRQWRSQGRAPPFVAYHRSGLQFDHWPPLNPRLSRFRSGVGPRPALDHWPLTCV